MTSSLLFSTVPDAGLTVDEPAQTSQKPRAGEMPTASWVIRERSTGRVILETFNPAVVAKVNTLRYEAVPILAHLQSLNRRTA